MAGVAELAWKLGFCFVPSSYDVDMFAPSYVSGRGVDVFREFIYVSSQLSSLRKKRRAAETDLANRFSDLHLVFEGDANAIGLAALPLAFILTLQTSSPVHYALASLPSTPTPSRAHERVGCNKFDVPCTT